jgi:hypothetical protein
VLTSIDITTLGGAGFASQRHQFGPHPLRLPLITFRGVTIHLPPQPNKDEDGALQKTDPSLPSTYTLVFRTSPPVSPPDHPKTPGGPLPASIVYESSFTPYPCDAPASSSTYDNPLPLGSDLARPSRYPSASGPTRQEPQTIHIPFTDFHPVYRGKEIPPSDPRYKPFDPTAIYELSFMCRSNFGEQAGEFELFILGLEGWRKEREGRGERDVGIL